MVNKVSHLLIFMLGNILILQRLLLRSILQQDEISCMVKEYVQQNVSKVDPNAITSGPNATLFLVYILLSQLLMARFSFLAAMTMFLLLCLHACEWYFNVHMKLVSYFGSFWVPTAPSIPSVVDPLRIPIICKCNAVVVVVIIRRGGVRTSRPLLIHCSQRISDPYFAPTQLQSFGEGFSFQDPKLKQKSTNVQFTLSSIKKSGLIARLASYYYTLMILSSKFFFPRIQSPYYAFQNHCLSIISSNILLTCH